MATTVDELAKIIWSYHLLQHTLRPPAAVGQATPYDLIFVLGSHDQRVAERAIELFHRKYAPKILFSGGIGNLTQGKLMLKL